MTVAPHGKVGKRSRHIMPLKLLTEEVSMAIHGTIRVKEGNIRHMHRDTEKFLIQTSRYLLLKKSVPVM
jgi:hypothetical protein